MDIHGIYFCTVNKYLLFLYFLICCIKVQAQQTAPAGVANLYAYSDKDGLTGYHYQVFTKGPSGKIYATDNSGTISIFGNNYRRTIPDINGKPGYWGLFIERDAKETWYCNHDVIAVIRGDTVAGTINLPKGNKICEGNRNGIYICDGTPDNVFFSTERSYCRLTGDKHLQKMYGA